MGSGDITIRRIEREYFVVQSDETGEPADARGPFKSFEEATNALQEWRREVKAAQAAQKPAQDAIEAIRDAYMQHRLVRIIANRIDREIETGKGKARAERAEKIRAELQDFEYPYPAIRTEPQAPGWLEQSTVKIIQPTSEQVRQWRESARDAANRHRHAGKNRQKVPRAVAARKANKETKKAKVLELTALGMTNEQIAEKLGISPRYVRKLRNERGRN